MNYRKKPVVIEAIQYTGDNFGEVYVFSQRLCSRLLDKFIMIYTLEGDMCVSVGDWIIKGVKGEFYPCKPDIFEATYEPVEEAP